MYESEEQQVEALKQWWQENAKQILFGAVLGLALVFGWRGWESHVASINARAAQALASMGDTLKKEKPDEALQQGAAIQGEFAATVYADLAALKLAKLHVEAGALDQAAEQLQRVIGHAEPAMADVARLRLARVLLAQQKPSEAETVLAAIKGQAYDAERSELQGDIALASGKPDQAREAYQRAMLAKHANGLRLERKLDDLAATGNPKS